MKLRLAIMLVLLFAGTCFALTSARRMMVIIGGSQSGNVAPGSIAWLITLGDPGIAGGGSVAPGTISAGLAITAPGPSGIGSVAPGSVAALLTLNDLVVTGNGADEEVLESIAQALALTAPSLSGSGGQTLSSISAVIGLNGSTVSGVGGTAPGSITALLALNAPAASAAGNVTLSSVALALTLAPTAQAANLTLGSVSAAVAVNAPARSAAGGKTLPSISAAVALNAPAATGGGPTCSGDFLANANETFSSGASAFCTTNISLSGGDTYSTSFYSCGTHGYVTSGTGDYILADIGSFDNDFYVRWVIKPADIPDYSQNGTVYATGEADDWDYHMPLKIIAQDTGGVAQDAFYICSTAVTCSTHYFTYTPGDTYLADVHAVCNGGTSTMSLSHWNGSGWDAVLSDDSNTSISVTSGAYQCRYMRLGTQSTYIQSFDDYRLSLSGAGYIGAQSCSE